MEIRFDVYGKLTLIIRRSQERWEVFRLGMDGKRGHEEIVIPPHIEADGLESYLEEVFHEWATPEQPQVRRIEK